MVANPDRGAGDVNAAATACPLCTSPSTQSFLYRENVPVHQNLVMPTREAARAIQRGTLDIAACRQCGFVFNRAFDAGKLAYGETYDNTQECSPAFNAYLDKLARHIVDECGVRGRRIVEVGCGKGTFLRRLVEWPGSDNRGHGFDPSYLGPDSDLGGRLTFHREFYGTDSGVAADVVVCRHVIEHVSEPLALLRAVRGALSRDVDARVFFETPCVEWILRGQVIWDFFYEHCSLFTAQSLSYAFAAAGFRVESVKHVFDDQYLWLEARPVANAPAAVCDAGNIVESALQYARAERDLLHLWKNKISGLRETGRVAIWGAAAKGSTFLNLVDSGCELVDCAVDLNPNKQGRYIPGTGHPIVDYHALPALGVRHVVLMNPNYGAENRSLLRESAIPADLIECP